MAANGSDGVTRKQLIATALCRYFFVDPETIPEDVEALDIKSIYLIILKLANAVAPKEVPHGVLQSIRYAEEFPNNALKCFQSLSDLNKVLVNRSVILAKGYFPCEADVIVFAVVCPFLHHVDFGNMFKKIVVEDVEFDFQKLDVLPKPGKSESGTKNAGEKKATLEKESLAEVEAVEKNNNVSVSMLNIQVGIIKKVWKYPSAERCLVELIDVGEAKPKHVVSGMAKFCSPEQLIDPRVVLITNVEPGILHEVMSGGLVLCAYSPDMTFVEPLLPPTEAKLGERVSFSGIDGNPEDVLN